MAFVQVVRLHQDIACPLWSVNAWMVKVPLHHPVQLHFLALRRRHRTGRPPNPGRLWLIGNEMDRRDRQGGGQDEMLPETRRHGLLRSVHPDQRRRSHCAGPRSVRSSRQPLCAWNTWPKSGPCINSSSGCPCPLTYGMYTTSFSERRVVLLTLGIAGAPTSRWAAQLVPASASTDVHHVNMGHLPPAYWRLSWKSKPAAHNTSR